MSHVFVHGLGAVSPAGWGVPALRAALERAEPVPQTDLLRPGWPRPLRVRAVPPPLTRPAFLSHPRYRRASVISHHPVAAALEALGPDAARAQAGELRIASILCMMAGCVTYSRRFYEEVLQDPSTASPLLFPETVFNAPASHLAAYLGSRAPSYTMVGDDTVFLQGLAVAADWLAAGKADGCLVIGVEEMDWLVGDALHLFARDAILGAGAGALYLRREAPAVNAIELAAITDVVPFSSEADRVKAAQVVRQQLPPGSPQELWCGSSQGRVRTDRAESAAWQDWPGARLAPKQWLGEAFTAASAWQCVAACDAIRRGAVTAANISTLGANQYAAGARFTAGSTSPIA